MVYDVIKFLHAAAGALRRRPQCTATATGSGSAHVQSAAVAMAAARAPMYHVAPRLLAQEHDDARGTDSKTAQQFQLT